MLQSSTSSCSRPCITHRQANACTQVKIGELGYANLQGSGSAHNIRLKRSAASTLGHWQAPEVSRYTGLLLLVGRIPLVQWHWLAALQ